MNVGEIGLCVLAAVLGLTFVAAVGCLLYAALLLSAGGLR